MPSQYVFLNSEALRNGSNPSASVINNNTIRISLNGLFSNNPMFVKVSVIQCEVQSTDAFTNGVTFCSDLSASNYRSLANSGVCLAILPDESKNANIYHYVLSSNEKPEYVVYGNLEQFTLYFCDYFGNKISFTDSLGVPNQVFGVLMKFETPDDTESISTIPKKIEIKKNKKK